MADIFEVRIARQAEKSLKRLPVHIVSRLKQWADKIVHEGLLKAREIPGYRDEALVGKRWGQRSIRLNRAYRAIYVINKDGFVRFVEVLEVNKHDY